MQPEFERVAIVNRGEAAMRFINAVREFNQERGTRIRTVALYTEPDRRAMFVREADEVRDASARISAVIRAARAADTHPMAALPRMAIPVDGRITSATADVALLERAWD